MKITQLHLANFKCFRDITLHLDTHLNVFTGVNNSGKTTILEALALWTECLTRLVQKTNKTDNRRRLNPGQYRIGSSQKLYVNPDDIISVRSPNFESIFHHRNTKDPIEVSCTLGELGPRQHVADDKQLTIGFRLKATRGSNYEISFLDEDDFDYVLFNMVADHLPRPVSLMYAAPVSAILPQEEFRPPPKLEHLVNTRQATQVLRNRLYRLHTRTPERWARMLDDIAEILGMRIEISFLTNYQDDIDIVCHAEVGDSDTPKDISLLGSGSLQVIEILLNIYSEPRDLDIVLLDEPDSHIHRDIQRRLIEIVQRESTHQIFISTHNESLLRSVAPRHIFHLTPSVRDKTEYWPILTDRAPTARFGLQPSPYLHVLNALGNETALDYLNALEAERLILVEGSGDARYLQSIYDRHGPRRSPTRAMYWAFNGLDNLLDVILSYKQIFSSFRNQRSLWDKSVLIFDRDYFTTKQRETLIAALQTGLEIPVYIWESYTLEATLLSERDKLDKLLVARLCKKGKGRARKQLLRLLEDEYQRLQVDLTERLQRSEYEQKILNTTGQRREALTQVLRKKANRLGIPKVDVTRMQRYRDEARELVGQGTLDHIATKDDVAAIVRTAYESVGEPFSEQRWFQELIEASTIDTRFDQWKEMIARVFQRAPA